VLGVHCVGDFSRVELGHSDCSAAPRMGPEEQLVGGAAEQSECWGFKVLQFVFGDVLPRGMRSAVRFDRPTCYPCPALPGAAHIMLYTSMVEASERTQSTSECWPKGEAGRAPLTKAVSLKRFLLLLSGRLFSAGVEG